MIDAVLLVAVFCACFGAFRLEDGRPVFNVAALALLASVAATSTLQGIEAQYSTGTCRLIDIAVIIVIAANAIVRRQLKLAEGIILALFVPVWALYGTPIAHDAITVIVSVQLLLTFPTRRFGHSRLVARWKANFRHRDEWTDLRARGASV